VFSVTRRAPNSRLTRRPPPAVPPICLSCFPFYLASTLPLHDRKFQVLWSGYCRGKIRVEIRYAHYAHSRSCTNPDKLRFSSEPGRIRFAGLENRSNRRKIRLSETRRRRDNLISAGDAAESIRARAGERAGGCVAVVIDTKAGRGRNGAATKARCGE